MLETGEEARMGACGKRQYKTWASCFTCMKLLLVSSLWVMVGQPVIRRTRTQSFVNTLLCQFLAERGVTEKKKMSSCHCQFGPVVVRRSLGHGSISRISPQMGLQACMKKGRKGGVGCSSKQKYLNADRREIILSSLVVGRRGGGGDS